MKEHIIRFTQVIELKKSKPEAAQCLIKKALKSGRLFQNLVSNANQFIELSKAFPKYTDDFIKILLNNTSLFEKIIVNVVQFIKITKKFPKNEDAFINKLLEHKTLFKKIVINKAMLGKLNNAFPKYNYIFNQPDTIKAITAANDYTKEKKSIMMNSILLSQAKRQYSTCIIGYLPNELLMEIGIFNRNKNILSKKYASEVFQQYFKKI